jgi:hypothetical protein
MLCLYVSSFLRNLFVFMTEKKNTRICTFLWFCECHATGYGRQRNCYSNGTMQSAYLILISLNLPRCRRCEIVAKLCDDFSTVNLRAQTVGRVPLISCALPLKTLWPESARTIPTERSPLVAEVQLLQIEGAA